jgi:hypothetical protein
MASDQRAFALREDAVESFSSAAATVAGEGREVRVEDLLKERKDGVIVVDAGPEADALATVEVLKEVSVPEAKSTGKSQSGSARKES